MNKDSIGWTIALVTAAFLIVIAVAGQYTYVASLKEQIVKSDALATQLQTQLGEKNQEITRKNEEIENLKKQNSGLSGDLAEKEAKLNKQLGEVKKLQTSLKTVSGCLVGTVGVIEAFKQNDGDLARNSALLMEGTCRQAGKIIDDVKNFPTSAQTAQY